jgi:DNA-binding transcriptional LysR family regulator
MVEVGLGVSVVAGFAVHDEVDSGRLLARPLAGGLYRSWGLVRRANETLTASQRGFISICNSLFPKLVA